MSEKIKHVISGFTGVGFEKGHRRQGRNNQQASNRGRKGAQQPPGK